MSVTLQDGFERRRAASLRATVGATHPAEANGLREKKHNYWMSAPHYILFKDN